MNHITDDALEKLKEFEGFRASPYGDPVGILTVGYGHVIEPGDNLALPLTEDTANDLLWDDLDPFQDAIRAKIKVPLNDNQFSALCLLCFNVGTAPLNGTLGLKLNRADYQGAADAILMWDHAGGKVLPGLTRRRKAERALFLS